MSVSIDAIELRTDNPDADGGMNGQSTAVPEAQCDADAVANAVVPMDGTAETSLPKYLKFTNQEAVIGSELYNYWDNRVIEHITSNGKVLALKVSDPEVLERSQADMMYYAATHGVLAPKVHGVYDVVTKRPIARVMVSERVPGVPLAEVWRDMSQAEQASIKEQLRVQIRHMRTLTQPFIGRLGRDSTRNLYDTTFSRKFGPFETEEEFDKWRMSKLYGLPFKRWRWKRFLQKQREQSSGKFVLTHGDLTPRNIMVEGDKITGIVDWELSGFFPEYMEYAIAIGLGPGMEEWWIPFLKEILVPCNKDRVKFTQLIESSPGSL